MAEKPTRTRISRAAKIHSLLSKEDAKKSPKKTSPKKTTRRVQLFVVVWNEGHQGTYTRYYRITGLPKEIITKMASVENDRSSEDWGSDVWEALEDREVKIKEPIPANYQVVYIRSLRMV